ncbi:MAG: response regulator [Acidobacteriota bacterium]|nr:response regulator [Acidobacteriota bacterium]
MTRQRPSLVVVDDEQGILDVITRFGERAGFDVVACSGGRQAIAQLQTRRADVAMVDLRMPDIGGLDVIRAIREIDPNCQSVLMTGYATVDTAVEAIKLGAMDYLSKPLDFARPAAPDRPGGHRPPGQSPDHGERRRAASRVLRDDRSRARDAGALRDDSAACPARADGAPHG